MIKPIVSNINELHKPCALIEPKEDVAQIIIDLKDTLATKKGYALAANQIGINKCICYLKVPKNQDPKTKEIIYEEFVAINPIIIEKSRKILLKQEGCLSFPGVRIDTDRYVFCIVEYEDEKRQKHTVIAQDLISFVWQHECSHLKGRIIFDDKHKRSR